MNEDMPWLMVARRAGRKTRQRQRLVGLLRDGLADVVAGVFNHGLWWSRRGMLTKVDRTGLPIRCTDHTHTACYKHPQTVLIRLISPVANSDNTFLPSFRSKKYFSRLRLFVDCSQLPI